MAKPILISIALTAFGTTFALLSLSQNSADNNRQAQPLPLEVNDAKPLAVEEHKAALQARWRAEREERDRQAEMSRRMMLREMHREQAARRQAMIEASKRRPVNVFAAPSVFVGD